MTALDERAAGFERALARHGVRVAPAQTLAFVGALGTLRTVSPRDLYWCARVAMLSSHRDRDRFDEAFVEYWTGEGGEAAPERPLENFTTVQRTIHVAKHEGGEGAVELAIASSDERLRDQDFAALSDEERDSANRLFARLRIVAERRRSRRLRAANRGERFDWRGTTRVALRTAGELTRLRYATRRKKVRPLVFLCDVSGSMEPYARALLRYAHVTTFARPRVRAFAFATRLTDLSTALHDRDADAALERASALLRDFGSGTRIGAALREFNTSFAQRGATRGATVVILSDGWEREDPGLVREQMARLRRLARRIVWVNPQKKHPDYEPLTRGMAAALPYVDAFIEGHNLRSLDAIADAIEGTT